MKIKIKKRALIIGLLFLAAAALAAGVVLPAYADTPAAPNSPTAAFHLLLGKVVSVSSPDFVVQTAKQGQLTVVTDSSTQYYIIPAGKIRSLVASRLRPNNLQSQKKGILANLRSDLGQLNKFAKKAGFSDIAVGDRVVVRSDSNNLAKQVLIIKAPVDRTIKGTIALTDPTHITITPAEGSPVTLNVVSTTRILLKGQTSITGYAAALYDSTNNDAVLVRVQATPPASPSTSN